MSAAGGAAPRQSLPESSHASNSAADKESARKQHFEQLKSLDAVFDHANMHSARPSDEARLDCKLSGDVVPPCAAQLAAQLRDGLLSGSTARCTAMLHCLSIAIGDWQPLEKDKLSVQLTRLLNKLVGALIKGRPHSLGQGNVIRFLKLKIAALDEDAGVEDIRATVLQLIDNFLQSRIEAAGRMCSNHAIEEINPNDTVLTYSLSRCVMETLSQACEKRMNLRLIVVDSSPQHEGQELVRRLKSFPSFNAFRQVQVIDISQAANMMPHVNICLVGASAVTTDGSVISRCGTGMIALLASHEKVRFVTCCESYKLTERLVCSSLEFNERAEPQLLTDSCCELQDWREHPNGLKVLQLAYDLTPSDLVSAIVTEHGSVEPHNVQLIFDEHQRDIKLTAGI